MEDQSKSIMKDMEETRSSMSAKLEALEDKVTGTVQPVADAVERVTEAAASAVERVTEAATDIVDDVKETVHGVAQKVEDTATAMTKAFSLSRQADRHPWVVFSVAATTGCVMGTLLGGRRTHRKASRSHGAQESRSRHSKDGNGKSHAKEAVAAKRSSASGSSQENVFGETIQHLKGLAIGSLMSLLRDLAKRSVPGPIGEKIAEEVESLTTRMGAQPIAGPVLGEEPERRPAKQSYGESGPSEGQGTASLDVANRLRAGGTGPGLR